jgi:hypothetical protein
MPPGYLDRRSKAKVKCPKCKQKEMARISRRGFLQKRIFPLLGMYPWQCAICGEEKLLQRRGTVTRKNERIDGGDDASFKGVEQGRAQRSA